MTVFYAVLFQRMYGCQKTGRNSIVGETFVNGLAVLCLERDSTDVLDYF